MHHHTLLQDEFPDKYRSDPLKIETIQTKAGQETGKSVSGLTILGKELFVVSGGSSDIDVYDSMKLGFSRRLNLKELVHAMDIESCNKNKCLYITDCKGFSGQLNEILRVDPSGNLIAKWPTGYNDGWGLSVTDQSSVILTVYSEHKLIEYKPDEKLIREINLSPGIRFPLHGIKLTKGHFVVCHGDADLHRVCVVDADGNLMKSFGGERGSTIEQMNRPVDLSVNGKGFVLVVDQLNSRILLLDSDLKFKREILSKEKHELQSPSRILLDESNGRMLVADNERILIFHFSE